MTISPRHTPGPWEYNDPKIYKQGYGKFSEVAVYAPGNAFNWRMAEVSGPNDATTIANARLIAAAPTMLDALVQAEIVATEICQGQNPANECWNILRQIQAAIARAEGK